MVVIPADHARTQCIANHLGAITVVCNPSDSIKTANLLSCVSVESMSHTHLRSYMHRLGLCSSLINSGTETLVVILLHWLYMDLYSQKNKMSHRKFLRSLETARSDVKVIVCLWLDNLKPISLAFEISRDLLLRRLVVWHNDVIKWKHFPRYWPFVRGIHRSPVNSPHKGQWHWALCFSLIYYWTNVWVNDRETGDLRRHCAHHDVSL